MKARQCESTKAKNEKVQKATIQIQNIYKEKFKENAINSFMLGFHSAFNLIGELYIDKLNKAETKEEREAIMAEMLERLEFEYRSAKSNIQKGKEDLERQQKRKAEKEKRQKAKKSGKK